MDTRRSQAIGDPQIRAWVGELWDESARHLTAPDLNLDDYRAALLDRFDNARIQHLPAQIGKDGTTKLRMRIVEVLLAEREAGRDAAASIRVLGAWVAQARSGALPEDTNGVAVAQAAAQGDRAVEALLTLIDERLTESDIVKAVTEPPTTSLRTDTTGGIDDHRQG